MQLPIPFLCGLPRPQAFQVKSSCFAHQPDFIGPQLQDIKVQGPLQRTIDKVKYGYKTRKGTDGNMNSPPRRHNGGVSRAGNHFSKRNKSLGADMAPHAIIDLVSDDEDANAHAVHVSLNDIKNGDAENRPINLDDEKPQNSISVGPPAHRSSSNSALAPRALQNGQVIFKNLFVNGEVASLQERQQELDQELAYKVYQLRRENEEFLQNAGDLRAGIVAGAIPFLNAMDDIPEFAYPEMPEIAYERQPFCHAYHEHERDHIAPERQFFAVEGNPVSAVEDNSSVPNHQLEHPCPATESRHREELKQQIMVAVLAVFPDICKEYISGLFEAGVGDAGATIVHILDKLDTGAQYPKEQASTKSLKRKKPLDEDDEEVEDWAKYQDMNRVLHHAHRQFVRELCQCEFLRTPAHFIDRTLVRNGYLLSPSYKVLEEAQRNWNDQNAPYQKLRKDRKLGVKLSPEAVSESLSDPMTSVEKKDILHELVVNRRVAKREIDKQERARLANLAEEENLQAAHRDGTMQECGCCFADFPLNRMICCDSKTNTHYFCVACARTTAENQIGSSRYDLTCMSMDTCTAGFTREERQKYLSEDSIFVLDKLEMNASIQAAEMEGFETCTKCTYGAIYPPVEINKVFQCEADGCKHQSCRLCKQEAHIPKTCEEAKQERGFNVRLALEEAMSNAMIRTCNKCKTPFIKTEGCNKMTCTNCRNMQCYVCSQSCNYNHFDDSTRGGKAGNCPLFEGHVETRHDKEVSTAEKIMIAKILSEHPEYSEEDLKIKFSGAVLNKPKPAVRPRPAMARMGGEELAIAHRAHLAHPNNQPHPLPQLPVQPPALEHLLGHPAHHGDVYVRGAHAYYDDA